jgi:hypothetical protein
MRALPFIGSRGARTLSGVPTVGPGDMLNKIDIGVLNATDSEIFLFGPVRIVFQGMVMCRLASTVSAVSDMHCERRAVIVGLVPADRRRGDVDLPCCSLRAHCSGACRGPPAAEHNYPLLTYTAL